MWKLFKRKLQNIPKDSDQYLEFTSFQQSAQGKLERKNWNLKIILASSYSLMIDSNDA